MTGAKRAQMVAIVKVISYIVRSLGLLYLQYLLYTIDWSNTRNQLEIRAFAKQTASTKCNHKLCITNSRVVQIKKSFAGYLCLLVYTISPLDRCRKKK